jgi:hypothetical protein
MARANFLTVGIEVLFFCQPEYFLCSDFPFPRSFVLSVA